MNAEGAVTAARCALWSSLVALGTGVAAVVVVPRVACHPFMLTLVQHNGCAGDRAILLE